MATNDCIPCKVSAGAWFVPNEKNSASSGFLAEREVENDVATFTKFKAGMGGWLGSAYRVRTACLSSASWMAISVPY